METLIMDFINYLRLERNYSEYTEDNYLIDLENYANYCKRYHLNFKKIKYQDIMQYEKYLNDLGLNSASINRHLSSLRSFYDYLLREGVLEHNPFRLIKGPKKPLKLPNYMKYSEFETMVNSCESTPLGIRNRALLEILLATGARIGEIINLEIADIDFQNNELKVLGKGSKERICYFGNNCRESLENYLANSRPVLLKEKKSKKVFINHLGDDLTTRGVRDIIDKIILKSSLNVKITPHTFRHTFATMLLNEGCDLKSVQELLGHVNLSTTSIYTHVTNDRIKDIYLHTHPRSKK